MRLSVLFPSALAGISVHSPITPALCETQTIIRKGIITNIHAPQTGCYHSVVVLFLRSALQQPEIEIDINRSGSLTSKNGGIISLTPEDP